MIPIALRRPITILVIFLGLMLFSVVALKTIPIDIFPKLNAPTIYVIEQYGGMSAQQMEGFFATRMADQFLYINGIKNIESKNIQGLTLLKLSFYEGTEMGEASAQVALQVARSQAFFPPGALPPQVIRFDASSLPVGELVFTSKNTNLKDIFDLAITRIRPLFAQVPGLTAPPPFGDNARSVLLNVSPEKLRMFNLSADDVVQAMVRNNAMTPSGNLRVDSIMYITSVNSLESKVQHFGDIPIKSNGSTTIYVRDVATVADGADITVDYALVNGKRSVYIPVVKTADASTWDVVQNLKKHIPEMQSLLPEDVKISYEFDQSVFVMNSAKSLMEEGIIGAVLTGLVVLLFLRDWRSSLVVIITIPVSILSAVLGLKLAGQTINIMTLSGLALAVGILVDEATVTIENIHQHLEMGKTKRQAVLDACLEISFAKLLILLCILAVFAPSFVMTGVPRAMFLPLSMSIGFAMIVSFLSSQTLVPVISVWMLKAEKFRTHEKGSPEHAVMALDKKEEAEIEHHRAEEALHPEGNSFFDRLKVKLLSRLTKWMPWRKIIVPIYLMVAFGGAIFCYIIIGKDLLPKTNTGQLQLRVREPDGTRLEVTEKTTQGVLAVIDSAVHGHIAISSAYVGLVPSSFGSSNLYIFTSGTHESLIQVNLDEDYKGQVEDLKEELRKNILAKYPEVRISFEPIELTDKIMAQGANTPIEVRVAGKNMDDIKSYASQLLDRLKQIPFLRDVQIAQPLNYPTVNITVDRNKLALIGLNIDDVSRSITDVTSSSRFTDKNLWLDNNNQYTYQTQVEVQEYIMNSLEQLKSTSLVKGQPRPVLTDVASVQVDTLPGEYDRSGPRRFVTVSANMHNKDLASATAAIQRSLKDMGEPPKGLVAQIMGESALLVETLDSLQTGLLAAIIVIMLLLAANFQSFGLSLAVLSSIPAVLLGSMLILLATGSDINLQSYMGLIMSTGTSVANAVLIVTNAEHLRHEYKDPFKAAAVAASLRFRPIMMTTISMIVGMIPMATGIGEAGDESAPLGRAVIGGLACSTVASLLIVPLVYGWIMQRSSLREPSLLPDNDPDNDPGPAPDHEPGNVIENTSK
jgi:multidrug efflux pump subunit AcrB